MRQEVFVQFGQDSEFELPVPADAAMSNADARRWLDQQFIANECEPLRASGKVLTADKLLAIADAVGPQRFENDASFRHDFSRAAVAALGKAVVVIDVEARSIDF